MAPWSTPPDRRSAVRGPGKAEVTVNDVKYDGKDDKGRPFSITADSASHVDGDDRHISLKKPLADIVMSSGAYVALTANDGLLDRDADIIDPERRRDLFHDNGLSFQTDSATINLKNKTAEGSEAGRGPEWRRRTDLAGVPRARRWRYHRIHRQGLYEDLSEAEESGRQGG